MKKISILLVLLMSIVMSTSYASPIGNKNIIIFVSFSMPDASIKEWMRQAAIINAPVVVRGFINNSFKETVHKMAELSKDNQGGVQIDPTLFQHFGIKQVPAVVTVKEADCIEGLSCSLDYDIVYGDVTLSYALNKIADQEDNVSTIANNGLTLLREESHA